MAGYERSDVQNRPMIYFALGLVVLSLGAFGLVVAMWQGLAYWERSGVAPSPLTNLRQAPPAPRLQPVPGKDLATVRNEDRKLITSYEWVDREHGIVRIPVERAIELLAERGLPAIKQPPTKVKK